MSLENLLHPTRAFLAMSATLAGYCLFRFYANTAGNQLVLPYLILAAAFLSLSDSAWQAILAAASEADAGAAGREAGLSPAAAFIIAVFTSLAGLMCAMTGGFNSFRAGGLLLLILLARHLLFRRLEIVSPVLGGASAAMFMVIGMTAHPAFIEMLHVREVRVPAAFFALYMMVARVMAMGGDSPRRRTETAAAMPAETAPCQLIEPTEDGVARPMVGFGGAVLIAMPPILGWIMPWSWLSWTFFGFLALSLTMALMPALAYHTRRELSAFVAAAQRGSVFLNAGAVASLGDYLPREIYEGWTAPMPGRDELAAAIIIVALATPAWFVRRQAAGPI